MSQQRLKAIAQARGIILRPSDPSAISSRQAITILGQGKDAKKSTAIGSHAVPNPCSIRKGLTAKTTKASDPLTSKIKVRIRGRR